jgi:hypothetical protein
LSRKKIYEEPFEAPSSEEIMKVVNALGGKAPVCRLCKKNWSTVDRWCKGEVKIDFANWKLISEINTI